ncbi:MAG: hypothetical protein QG635_1333 [Bacteroidota bacterium]|nr:hypothetical protein [Bacteroidota bacterium]
MKYIIYCFLLLFAIHAVQGQSISSSKDLLKAGKPYFIENKGQWQSEVRFLAKISGMNAWITKSGVVYDFYKIKLDTSKPVCATGNPTADLIGIESDKSIIYGDKIKSAIIGSYSKSDKPNSSDCLITGLKKLEGVFNFFKGADSAKWVINVPIYEEVRLNNVSDGIDIRYYFDKIEGTDLNQKNGSPEI